MDSVTNHKINIISQNKTWLFVPATRIDRVAKAFASGADAVIVRFRGCRWHQRIKTTPVKHYNNIMIVQIISRFWVRINKAGSEEFLKDISALSKNPKFSWRVAS